MDQALRVALWKDRDFVLRVAAELESLYMPHAGGAGAGGAHLAYGALNSYQRLLVHRAAAYYALAHDAVQPDGVVVYILPTSVL